ncbi:MAG: YqeG family HAD IIIA-type phosphatase [Clostridia bacterium]|nr:YqeG family HAD IIIA-type phosphatase [Clostridia bacterium]
MRKNFYPDTQLNTVYELTPQWLSSRGVKALICDLDDTLAPYFDTTPTEKLAAWVQSMRDAGIKICILSNGKKHRITPFCQTLGIDVVPMAAKPLPFGYFRALKRLGVKRKEVVAIGDQIFTDILGGNCVGIHTVLVEPIAYKTSKMERRKRRYEKQFRRVLKRTKQKGKAC